MSNVLSVNEQATIKSLSLKGWSVRRIAREPGLNGRTVKRDASKCTTQVTAGHLIATEENRRGGAQLRFANSGGQRTVAHPRALARAGCATGRASVGPATRHSFTAMCDRDGGT